MIILLYYPITLKINWLTGAIYTAKYADCKYLLWNRYRVRPPLRFGILTFRLTWIIICPKDFQLFMGACACWR